jgi:hypothetical protein
MRLMFTPCPLLRAWTLLLAAALLSPAFAAHAAKPPAGASGRTKAATNAVPVEPEPAKSVFVIPSSSKEGKDPFFPQSSRLNKAPVATKGTTNLPQTAVDLQLKGISGGANRRLAIINNRTFETGEEGEVTSGAGVVRITCQEIKDDSVRVLLNGRDRTLRLRSGH